MATNDFKRKLIAILHADVKGYSRLIGEDENATVSTLTAYREVMGELIQKHRGRVVHGSGDSLLAEFISVIDAVQCAVEIQKELEARNAELSENRKVEFRIGINLGDVIDKDEDLHGDGVNIAARIEGLAEGGGICISRTAFDQVRNKLKLGYEYIGEHSVKNVAQPVRVYRVLMESEDAGKVIGEKMALPKHRWKLGLVAVVFVIFGAIAVTLWNTYFRAPSVEVASVEKMAFPLPDKPSIAVLPFDNLSGDSSQEYFSDGLTDQIITGLSKVPHLFVIARNSTFTFKGKSVKVQKVAEDLGVKYVLEGSVQKTADQIRITAQLIDATTGHHLWSERYDRDLEDIFAIQDDITMEIMKAMQVKLTRGEQARLWGKHETTNLEAYGKFMEARAYILRVTKEDVTHGRQLVEEAIALDSGFAAAYAILGWTHFFDARFGWTESRVKSIKMAFEYAQKALEMDDTLDYSYALLSAVYLVKRQYEKAVAAAEHAFTLNPNGALVHNTLAGVVGCSGRWEDSIIYGKKSIRLNPFPPPNSFHWLGRAYFMTGQYDEAILTFKKALDVNPNYLPAHAFLAATYSSVGRETDASAAAEQVLRINPKFSLESYAKTLPYKNKADIERYVAALRKAGLPESSPLPLPNKPSIAVLPFDNLSGDPEQEYLADGISENIISALSKISKMFVIARNSTFTYKGKPVKVQQVSRELGVRYVLEGSVQKAGDQLRISAQLVDATTGNHIWSERYDRKLKDLFTLQDDITKKIITAMQVKLTEGEQARAAAKGTNNLEAYLKCLQARENMYQMNIESNALARQLAEEAINIDPEYAEAYKTLSKANMMDVLLGSSDSPKESITLAIDLAQKALTLDESLADAHSVLGFLYTMIWKHDKGVAEAELAVALDPNLADAYSRLGLVYRFSGMPEKAIPVIKKAIRLNPMAPGWYFYNLATAYAFAGKCEEAIEACGKALQRETDNLLTHITTTVAYCLCEREEEAKTAAAGVLRISPKFSTKYFAKTLPYKYQADLNRYIEALRKAGLK